MNGHDRNEIKSGLGSYFIGAVVGQPCMVIIGYNEIIN